MIKRVMFFWRVILIAGVVVLGAGISGAVRAQEEPLRIIFMHHSTGENLIFQGGVIEGFASLGYEFWHHGYNGDGLSDENGNYTFSGWDVPGDNTDPDGWYEVFNQPVTDPPSNTFSHMLQYDVIIFKSCFPSSDIYDEDLFEAYRQYYLSIRDVMDQHPDKLFIPWTTPPLVPNSTDAENAARARRWSEYLTSDEYLEGHPNVAVFDIFSQWADEDDYLAAEYRVDEWDSHPNEIANQTVGPVFVSFVDEAIRAFVPGAVPPPVEASAPPEDTAPEEPAAAVEPGDLPAGTGAMIDDFEGGDFDDTWWTDTAVDGGTFACGPGQPGYDYEHSLHITFDLGLDVYVGCGRDVVPTQQWADAEGLTFMWQADTPGNIVAIIVSVDETPFEAFVETPGMEWTPVILTWEDFARAEWADAGGAQVFDSSRVTSLAIGVGDWENPQRGTIWLDALQLVTGESADSDSEGESTSLVPF